jgi:hypothetical protein
LIIPVLPRVKLVPVRENNVQAKVERNTDIFHEAIAFRTWLSSYEYFHLPHLKVGKGRVNLPPIAIDVKLIILSKDICPELHLGVTSLISTRLPLIPSWLLEKMKPQGLADHPYFPRI